MISTSPYSLSLSQVREELNAKRAAAEEDEKRAEAELAALKADRDRLQKVQALYGGAILVDADTGKASACPPFSS